MLYDILWLIIDGILLFVVSFAILKVWVWLDERKEHRILCPKCKRKRGFIVRRTTLREPDSVWDGREQVDCQCAECGATFTQYREIPRHREHDYGGFGDGDDSSSSYGGGSFSGGGSGTSF